MPGEGSSWPVRGCLARSQCRVNPVSQGKQEENNVVEKLNLFLDLLQSYKVSLSCSVVRDRAFEKGPVTLEGCDSRGWRKT